MPSIAGSFNPDIANDHEWPDAYAVTLESATADFDAGQVLYFNSLEEPRRHDIVAVIDRALHRTLGTLVLPLPASQWDALPHADGVVTFRPFDGETTMVAMSDLLAIHRCDGISDDETVPDSLLPVDEYEVEIVSSTYSEGRLDMEAVVTEGPYVGQSLPLSLVLEGDGAEEGQALFAALRRAVGVLEPTDTSELHHRLFTARVDVIMNEGELENTLAPVPNRTAASDRFLFDMEGKLLEMVALASSLESLLLHMDGPLRLANPSKATAIDYNIVNLADLIREVEQAYFAARYDRPASVRLAA